MTTSIGGNTGWFAVSTRASPHVTTQQHLHLLGCFSMRSRLLAGAREVKARRFKNIIFSISKNNNCESSVMDAGVDDIDPPWWDSDCTQRCKLLEGGFGYFYPKVDSYSILRQDGIGAKLKLAIETGIHDTIGIDLVAMTVNGIITYGAKPLSMRKHFHTTNHDDVDLVENVIKGIVKGCEQCDCALLGGKTAEIKKEFRLYSTSHGTVKKDSLIVGKNIVVGDVLIGLPSSGVHSTGFFLVRRILSRTGLSLTHPLPGEAISLGEALMSPTVIYAKQVQHIITKVGGVKGIAHITGGGLTKEIPRVLPQDLGAVIHKDSWEVPTLFKWLKEVGRIEDAEMRVSFNMGIGMVLVVSQQAAIRILGDKANKAYLIGEVITGEGVTYL